MRVFKSALGVLALTLGFGLSSSVRAETIPDKDIVEIAASAGSFSVRETSGGYSGKPAQARKQG